jgi:hypothetical protein
VEVISITRSDVAVLIYELTVQRIGRGRWQWKERTHPKGDWLRIGAFAEAAAAQDLALANDIRKMVPHLSKTMRAPGSMAIGAKATISPGEIDGQVVFGWIFEDLTAAARTSAVMGYRFGALRVCTERRCQRVFVAERRDSRLCKECTKVRAHLGSHKRVRRVMDRLRKRGDQDQRDEAWADLRAMQILQWFNKWDQRGPRGRRPSLTPRDQ